MNLYGWAFLAGLTCLTACSDDDNNDNPNLEGGGNGGNETTEVTTLKGTITEDVTLKAGKTYKLSGEYIVENGATLHIEEGVTIEAIYDDLSLIHI